jgi:hypothetical protein
MSLGRTDEQPDVVGFRLLSGWWFVLLALLSWHGLATLRLFDPDHSGRSLSDDRPILSGSHPLHLYHAMLGAASWRNGDFGSCYDPWFQAGYPKTPVFDSGSRPGELFLLVGGESARAYKSGLALCLWCGPFILTGVAWLLECKAGTCCLAALLGILWWWSGPTQRLVHDGDIHWLLAGLMLVTHTALTVKFHRTASMTSWIGLTLTAALGWFLHPILWLGFGFLFIPFFVIVATAHSLIWNIALWLAWGLGLALNWPWLMDWWHNCWIQMPLPVDPSQTLRQSLENWFADQIGGTAADRLLALFLLAHVLFGTFFWILRGQSTAGLTFAATAIVLPVLSLGSAYWQPLEAIGTSNLLVLAVLVAIVPCAAGLTSLAAICGRITKHPIRGAAVLLSVFGGIVAVYPDETLTWIRQVRDVNPLRLGLNREQHQLISTLKLMTRSEARILWEERPEHPTPSWSALLPFYTGRAFVGGLDPQARVDHTYARLTSTHLAGRPLFEWTDAELSDFCDRYNISYIVCWSSAVVKRFQAWSSVTSLAPIREAGEGWLLEVRRLPSFILKGKAEVTQMDSRRIALSDVEPENGVVVLSLHYQEGFRITPSHIQAEREPDPDDPIPRLRLRVPSPTLRVTLTWGK